MYTADLWQQLSDPSINHFGLLSALRVEFWSPWYILHIRLLCKVSRMLYEPGFVTRKRGYLVIPRVEVDFPIKTDVILSNRALRLVRTERQKIKSNGSHSLRSKALYLKLLSHFLLQSVKLAQWHPRTDYNLRFTTSLYDQPTQERKYPYLESLKVYSSSHFYW